MFAKTLNYCIFIFTSCRQINFWFSYFQNCLKNYWYRFSCFREKGTSLLAVFHRMLKCCCPRKLINNVLLCNYLFCLWYNCFGQAEDKIVLTRHFKTNNLTRQHCTIIIFILTYSLHVFKFLKRCYFSHFRWIMQKYWEWMKMNASGKE